MLIGIKSEAAYFNDRSILELLEPKNSNLSIMSKADIDKQI
jgi:hypothetical protein